MIVARINDGGLRVQLVCRVCATPMTMSEVWGVVPPDSSAGEEIVWMHRPCVNDGDLRRMFGTKRVVLLKGEDTLRRLIMGLCEEPVPQPDHARKKHGAMARARVAVPDVQGASRKARVR